MKHPRFLQRVSQYASTLLVQAHHAYETKQCCAKKQKQKPKKKSATVLPMLLIPRAFGRVIIIGSTRNDNIYDHIVVAIIGSWRKKNVAYPLWRLNDKANGMKIVVRVGRERFWHMRIFATAHNVLHVLMGLARGRARRQQHPAVENYETIRKRITLNCGQTRTAESRIEREGSIEGIENERQYDCDERVGAERTSTRGRRARLSDACAAVHLYRL